MSSVTLEVFADLVCPWCYLSTPRIERIRRNFDIDVQWVFFPLHPDTPPAGTPLIDLFAPRGIDPGAVHARLKNLMDLEGLPFSQRTHTYNSRLAQELATGFKVLREPLYRAYFVDGANLADIDVLVRVAVSAGISAEEVRRALVERSFGKAVDADWANVGQAGITAIPSFRAGDRILSGVQPYDVLETFVIAAGAKTEITKSIQPCDALGRGNARDR